MSKIILDIGDESPETYSKQCHSSDIVIAKFNYIKLPYFIKYSSPNELYKIISSLRKEDNHKLLIFYDSKKKLLLILNIALNYGYFKTKTIYGNRSLLWHWLLFYEVIDFLLIKF